MAVRFESHKTSELPPQMDKVIPVKVRDDAMGVAAVKTDSTYKEFVRVLDQQWDEVSNAMTDYSNRVTKEIPSAPEEAKEAPSGIKNSEDALDQLTEELSKMDNASLERLIWAVAQLSATMHTLSMKMNNEQMMAMRDTNHAHVKKSVDAQTDWIVTGLHIFSAVCHATTAFGALAPRTVESGLNWMNGVNGLPTMDMSRFAGQNGLQTLSDTVTKTAGSVGQIADQVNNIEKSRDQAVTTQANADQGETQQMQQMNVREKDHIRQKQQAAMQMLQRARESYENAVRTVLGR